MLSALALAWVAGAVPLEPTQQAARSLGYAVVGEIKFSPRAVDADQAAFARELGNVREACPRARTPPDRAFKKSHLVVFAWADREFPTAEQNALSPREISLASARAERLADRLRGQLGPAIEFDLINMADRAPQTVRVLDGGRVNGPRFDAKTALRLTGAAPTSPLEVGLFGEFAQRSKVVLFADCEESFTTRPATSRASFSLARN